MLSIVGMAAGGEADWEGPKVYFAPRPMKVRPDPERWYKVITGHMSIYFAIYRPYSTVLES